MIVSVVVMGVIVSGVVGEVVSVLMVGTMVQSDVAKSKCFQWPLHTMYPDWRMMELRVWATSAACISLWYVLWCRR